MKPFLVSVVSRRDPRAIACAHTNTVESFNATLKRAIIGVWHWFSVRHCDRYLNEWAKRWDMRERDTMERFNSVLAGVFNAPLT